jgi:trk system potassium uptake protein TrkA
MSTNTNADADADPRDLRVVVAGGGSVGLRAARLLHDRGHTVILVENDEDRIERLSDEYVASVIVGDATRPSIIRQAQPGRCDVVAALTDDEAANFAVCVAVQRMADVRTVMRVTSEPDELYAEYVDGVVFAEGLGARAAVNEIAGVGVRTLEDVSADLEILEVEIAPDAPVADRRLDEVSLPRGSLIIADAAGGRIGGADTVLAAGERYLVAVESGVADEVMRLLRG